MHAGEAYCSTMSWALTARSCCFSSWDGSSHFSFHLIGCSHCPGWNSLLFSLLSESCPMFNPTKSRETLLFKPVLCFPLPACLLLHHGLGERALLQAAPAKGCHCPCRFGYRHIGNEFLILSLTGMQSQLLAALYCSLGISVFRCVVMFLCKWK